jgi:hypothetical protein
MKKTVLVLTLCILMFSLSFVVVQQMPTAISNPTGMVWQTSLWPMPETGLEDENFGKSVTVGDVNGDGFDDVIVCSDFGIRVYEGPVPAQDGWVWADPMLEIDVHSYSIYERDVAVADVNNDNIMDIIIGFARSAPAYYYNGWVAAFYGKTE